MQAAAGIRISNGITIGKIRFYRPEETFITAETIAENQIESELSRFETARLKAIEQQRGLYQKALSEVAKETAVLFDVHAMMLEDDDLVNAIRDKIAVDRHNAEYAVRKTCSEKAQIFADMTDPYMQARSADLIDIGQCVLDFLTDRPIMPLQEEEPVILAARDLSPSEMIRLDRSGILGFITEEGSTNSHTAILARSMNIPALAQVRELSVDWDGKTAILDAGSSRIYIDPSDVMLTSYRRELSEAKKQRRMLADLKGKSSTTLDGRKIGLFANIGSPADIEAVHDNDAEGVGLFRTEYIYLGSHEEPTEEEQFESYRKVVKALAPGKVVFRTMDLGADKTVEYLSLAHEENPALGYRAIRISLSNKALFTKQLRALLRVSVYGDIGIMFPMITSLKELRKAKAILAECRDDLIREGKTVGTYKVGTMIETPAAVLIADRLAEECSFFSIGTNDLLQYTCALDRQNAMLDPFYDKHHPAVIEEIRMTVAAGHRHGIPVAICGEMGGDPALTEEFLRMGVDELSVNPANILPLRRTIRGIDLSRDR